MVTSHLWLICQWLNNSEHFGACCNLLSFSEQKIWPFNWRKVRKKSWPMMTSKSDRRGHPGLKLCVRVSVMGYYRVINFHQNRRGSGIFLGDFTWNDPNILPCYRRFLGRATFFLNKFNSNVCLGGFAGSEPSLSIACCAGPDPTTRSRNFSAMAEFYPNV